MSWPTWLKYGNWTGPGWSGGKWENNPEKIDYTMPGVDELDEGSHQHDIDYKDRIIPRWRADFRLVKRSWKAKVKGVKANTWRILLLVGMPIAGTCRMVASPFVDQNLIGQE